MTWLRGLPLFLTLVLLSVPGGVLAGPAPNHGLLCEKAAREVAATTGVPPSVLLAITLAETGRTQDGAFSPWPWTLNVAGQGFWFDKPEDARQFIRQQIDSGNRNFDVGCFQINYYWHQGASLRPDSMLDPLTSARYAASFLKTLHDESGDWSTAAGAYHSRTPHYAEKYRKRFDRIRSAYLDQDHGHDLQPLRRNAFPLFLVSEGKFTKGSLFDLSLANENPFIANEQARGSLFR